MSNGNEKVSNAEMAINDLAEDRVLKREIEIQLVEHNGKLYIVYTNFSSRPKIPKH